MSFPELVQGQVVELVLRQAPVSAQEREQASAQEREQERERERERERVWVQHLQRRRRQ